MFATPGKVPLETPCLFVGIGEFMKAIGQLHAAPDQLETFGNLIPHSRKRSLRSGKVIDETRALLPQRR